MKKRSTQLEAHAMTQKPQTDQGVRVCQEFTIANPDARSALYFWLEVTEPRSFPLIDWHSFTPVSPTYLEPGETKTITLNFDVPNQVAPGIYDYTIAYKFEHNIEQTLRAPLQLEILAQPSNRVKKRLSFTIAPATTSEAPHSLQPGKLVVFNLKIKNQSAIADLIYLRCSELPANWFTVCYPERTAETLGIVQADTGLQLNPEESGEIQFMLHPPSDAPARLYSPTLQLVSMNAPDLVTLDVVYFQVLPDTKLDVDLTPAVRSIGHGSTTFSLKIRNRGNIERTVSIAARDSENLFRFDTDAPDNTVTLAPGRETSIALQATPRQIWQRPLRKLRRSQVSVILASIKPSAELAVPYVPQVRLIWQPQPKWVLAVLMLMGTSTIAVLLGLLYRFNRQPVSQAEILSFSPTQRNYSESQSSAVRLNWKLQNPGNVNKLVIARLDEGAETETQTYQFSSSIPKELQVKADSDRGCRTITPKPTARSFAWELPLPKLPWFSSLQQPANTPTLDCRDISFAAAKPGAFQYKLKVFAANSKVPIAEQTTETITVKATEATQATPETTSSPSAIAGDPGQPPQIVSFTVNGEDALSQPTHTYPLESGESATVVVSWRVQGGDGLEVRLLPFTGAVAPQGSTTYLISPGIKTITLTARNRLGEQVTQSVDVQAIAPTLRSRPARPPARRSTPQPSPRLSPSVTPSPEPSPDPGLSDPQTTPDPNNNTPSPSISPSPEVSPSSPPQA